MVGAVVGPALGVVLLGRAERNPFPIRAEFQQPMLGRSHD